MKLKIVGTILVLYSQGLAQGNGNPVFLQNGQSQIINGTPVFCGYGQTNPSRKILLEQVYLDGEWWHSDDPNSMNIRSVDGAIFARFEWTYPGSQKRRIRISLGQYPYSGNVQMTSDDRVSSTLCRNFTFSDDAGNSLRMTCSTRYEGGKLTGTLTIR